MRNRLIDTETDWQLSEGRGLGDWVKKVKGLGEIKKTHTYAQTTSWCLPEGRGGR